eukprot:scaffold11278_cov145-Isochrysis_galbana.AAC.10
MPAQVTACEPIRLVVMYASHEDMVNWTCARAEVAGSTTDFSLAATLEHQAFGVALRAHNGGRGGAR